MMILRLQDDTYINLETITYFRVEEGSWQIGFVGGGHCIVEYEDDVKKIRSLLDSENIMR